MKLRVLAYIASCVALSSCALPILAQDTVVLPGSSKLVKAEVSTPRLWGKSLASIRRLWGKGELRDKSRDSRGTAEDYEFTVPGFQSVEAFFRADKLISLGFFFKETLTWDQALQKVGLSAAGVRATRNEGGNVKITGVKGLPKSTSITFRVTADSGKPLKYNYLDLSNF